MAVTGRPRTYASDRPATAAERQARWRQQHRPAGPPDVVCKTFGSCTLYCSRWEPLYALLPRDAAVITDPPYDAHYDWTKARRRPAKWDTNFVGYDQDFDPTPWLRFPEVILLGANRYWERLPRPGSLWVWDKTPGQRPSDFASHEWIWLSMGLPPRVIPYLWRGGMREGKENYVHLPQKFHPAQKPEDLMIALVQATAVPVVIDPYMGSGTTVVACLQLGRPCIGIEMDPTYFETACARVQKELQQPPLFE